MKFQDGVDISFIIFGNNPQIGSTKDGQPICKYYDVFQQGNIAIIKVKSKETPLTTIDIKLADGSFYHDLICYSPIPTTTFYDFSKPKTIEKIEVKKTKEEKAIKKNNTDTLGEKDKSIDANLEKLVPLKQEYKDIALIKKNVVFQVVNIVNDDSYTYIKLLVDNKSSNLYEIDGITFKVAEGAKKSIFKKELVNQNYLNPRKIIYPKDKQIKAYTSEYVYFVIPLYTTNSGTLIIKIVEKNGLRNADVIVNATDLNNVKIFSE